MSWRSVQSPQPDLEPGPAASTSDPELSFTRLRRRRKESSARTAYEARSWQVAQMEAAANLMEEGSEERGDLPVAQ